MLEGEAYALRIKQRTGTVGSVALAGFEVPVRAFFDATANDTALAALYRDDAP